MLFKCCILLQFLIHLVASHPMEKETDDPEDTTSTTDCIRFTDCPAFQRIAKYNRTDDPDVIRLLQDSACGESQRKDKIFCNRVAKFLENSIRMRLPPNKCGQLRSVSKVYGGRRTELDEFNWVALLRYRSNTGHLWYKCHGSLISEKHVVTAAHCLEDSLHSVVLGEYDIRSSRDCVHDQCADPIQEISVKFYRKHPEYQPSGALNDIGLIWLNGAAIFSDYVGPICLPVNVAPVHYHEPLVISGWGTTENNTMSDFKLKAVVLLAEKSKCTEQRVRYHTPDETILCADGSSRNADICAGDSGGPLMIARAMKDLYTAYLAGVISVGGTCGIGVGVYTNVSHFRDWIEKNMAE